MSNENKAREKENKNKHQTTHVKMYHIEYSKIAALVERNRSQRIFNDRKVSFKREWTVANDEIINKRRWKRLKNAMNSRAMTASVKSL